MFISLKRWLDGGPERLSEALLRMARLLVHAIELHAVKGDAADYEKFRADMQQVQQSLAERPTPSEILVLAGTVVTALEGYNRRTSRFMQIQCAELQAMVSMLTKTMTALSTGSEASVARLQSIEQHLHKASMIEDFQTARLRLAECLEGLRAEITRQKEESARTVSAIKTELSKSQERLASAPGLPRQELRPDPVTGLPGRAAAEAALLEAGRENRTVYAAVFALDRLDLINTRFGYAMGDRVLLTYSQLVAQALSGADQLFRWSGPALVALLEREGQQMPEVREELARFANQRVERTFQAGGRSALLPVAANWALFPLAHFRPVQLLFYQMDNFVLGGPKQPADLEVAQSA